MIKSIKTLALNISEDEYRVLPAYSYSGIASFYKTGPITLIKPEFKESMALRNGSAFDTLLTEPEEFHNKFIVQDMPPVTDTVREIVETLLCTHNAPTLAEIPFDTFLKVLNAKSYSSTWKDATRVNKIIELGSEYYNILKISEGKRIITQEEYENCVNGINKLRELPATRDLLSDNPFATETEGVFQLKLMTTLHNTPVRCMFDRIVVNHNTKTIIPLDLKTTGGKEEEFESSFVKWMYFIQASLYSDILKDVISKDEYFKDFTVLPFRFVVINVKELNPIVWVVEDIEYILNKLKNKGYPPYYEILDDMNWHTNNSIYHCTRATYEGGGVRTITLPFFRDDE